MANIDSQKKRIRRSRRERVENLRYISAARTYFRRLSRSANRGDKEAVEADYRNLVSVVDKAAKTGALHRNTAARKKSKAARIRASVSS